MAAELKRKEGNFSIDGGVRVLVKGEEKQTVMQSFHFHTCCKNVFLLLFFYCVASVAPSVFWPEPMATWRSKVTVIRSQMQEKVKMFI